MGTGDQFPRKLKPDIRVSDCGVWMCYEAQRRRRHLDFVQGLGGIGNSQPELRRKALFGMRVQSLFVYERKDLGIS